MAFAVVWKGSGQEAFVFGDRGQSKVAVVTHEGFHVPPGWHGHQNDPRIRTAQNGVLDDHAARSFVMGGGDQKRTGGEPLHGPSRDVFKRISHANCLQAGVCIQFPLGQRIRGDFLGHVDQAGSEAMWGKVGKNVEKWLHFPQDSLHLSRALPPAGSVEVKGPNA